MRNKFKTGLLWQDHQHEKLFLLIESIDKKEDGGFRDTDYANTLANLVIYITEHFSLEERYMRTFGYPDIEYHCNLHKKFAILIKDFRNKNPRCSMQVLSELKDILTKWIKDHILHNDVKLAIFIKDKES